MAKEIKELTNIMIEEQEFDSQSDRWKAEIDAAYIALENQCYKQAWDHFYKVHSLTFSESKLAKEREHDFYYFKGEASHGLCKVMQEIPNDDEFVKYLIETDRDLIRKSKSKNVSGRYARSFIGRKYLKYAADDCGYYPAMIEYALNCVGSGHKKSFVFEYNDRDAQVGLQWANRILLSSFKEHKAHGYAIYAKYYFARYSASKSQDDLLKFCDNVMSAIENDNSNEYAMYFYAHMCSNPSFKNYNNGKHYDPIKGYDLFCQIMEKATDPDLTSSAKNIKLMLETKYPNKIKIKP